jgi:phosphatidylglycerophosphate synthase
MADRIYTIVFPLAIVAVAISKLCTARNWVDIIILFSIIIISFLYLTYKHFNDFKKKGYGGKVE